MRTSFALRQQELAKWVAWKVELATPEGNATKEQHLRKAAENFRKQGKSDEEVNELLPDLIEPEVHPYAEYLKWTFVEVNSARGQGLSGPLPISYQELKAYCDLMDEELSPLEVQTIRLMDTTYINEVNKRMPK